MKRIWIILSMREEHLLQDFTMNCSIKYFKLNRMISTEYNETASAIGRVEYRRLKL